MDENRCDKCKQSPQPNGLNPNATITCTLCGKTYRRCLSCGGQAGVERSLTAHAGFAHQGQGAGPRARERA